MPPDCPFVSYLADDSFSPMRSVIFTATVSVTVSACMASSVSCS